MSETMSALSSQAASQLIMDCEEREATLARAAYVRAYEPVHAS